MTESPCYLVVVSLIISVVPVVGTKNRRNVACNTWFLCYANNHFDVFISVISVPRGVTSSSLALLNGVIGRKSISTGIIPSSSHWNQRLKSTPSMSRAWNDAVPILNMASSIRCDVCGLPHSLAYMRVTSFRKSILSTVMLMCFAAVVR